MATQSERRERTRHLLIAIARNLFGRQGYSMTKMDDVAKEAGVAKGAVYHHFKSKRDLFEGVLLEVSAEVTLAVQKDLQSNGDLVQAMRTSIRKFFSLCSDPKVFQILLKDGPAVLGWQRWREIDVQNFGGMVRSSLSFGIENGILKPQPIEPLSHLIIGAISEAAMDSASQDCFEKAALQYVSSLDLLIEGLKIK